MTIYFHSSNAENKFLSNFYPASFFVRGKQFPTIEHYFQHMKFVTTSPTFADSVSRSKTPAAAKSLGRRGPLRPDWEQIKENVMLEGLRAKFTQNGDLGDSLIATGDALLSEHTSRDKYWGDGGNGSGKNRLGLLLMQVRDELSLKDSESTPDP